MIKDRANHSYLQPVAELQRTQISSRDMTTNHGSQLRSRCWFYRGRRTQRKTLKACLRRHIEGVFNSRHMTTNHRSQLRSRCWFYRGRKTGEPGEKPFKHGSQLQQLYSYMSSKCFENQHEAYPLYPLYRWSPIQL